MRIDAADRIKMLWLPSLGVDWMVELATASKEEQLHMTMSPSPAATTESLHRNAAVVGTGLSKLKIRLRVPVAGADTAGLYRSQFSSGHAGQSFFGLPCALKFLWKFCFHWWARHTRL